MMNDSCFAANINFGIVDPTGPLGSILALALISSVDLSCLDWNLLGAHAS